MSFWRSHLHLNSWSVCVLSLITNCSFCYQMLHLKQSTFMCLCLLIFSWQVFYMVKHSITCPIKVIWIAFKNILLFLRVECKNFKFICSSQTQMNVNPLTLGRKKICDLKYCCVYADALSSYAVRMVYLLAVQLCIHNYQRTMYCIYISWESSFLLHYPLNWRAE